MAQITAALARAARWARPSVQAAAIGAVVAGGVEAWLHVSGGLLRVTSAGYAVAGLWPAAAGAAALTRLARRGWRPDAPDGPDAPAPADHGAGLAALALVAAAAVSALAWTGWAAVRWAALHTAFKPTTLALIVPGAVAGCGALVAALAWPCARALRGGLRAFEQRWQARRGRPPWTRRRVAAALLVLAVLGCGALALLLRRRLGAPQLSAAQAPVLALLVTGLARPLATTRARRVGALACALAALAVAAALAVRVTRPALVLDAWAAPTVAAEVIEQVHELEALRAQVLPAQAAPRPLPGVRAHPDVVLITIDTVRADRTPLAGGPARMPQLAQLAQRAAVMTRAYAPGNVTRRSLTSLATGLSPTRVRGKVFGWALRLDPRHVLLAERFAAAGYRTAGFLCCDTFWGRQLGLGLDRGLAELVLDRNGAVLAERAAALLRAQRGAAGRPPLFLWLHFLEPHQWNGGAAYLPAPETARTRYDAALAKVDALLGQVLAALDPDAPPVVVVTADHGEGLGDHGSPYHGTDLYDSQLRVPLVIAGPGIAAARHAEVTGLVDLAPTLLELAGFEVPADQLEGRSLASLLRGQRPSDDDGGYAFAAMVPDRSVPERRTAVMRGRWKLILGPLGPEVYDTEADPGELRNLAGGSPAFGELRRLLREREALDARSPFAPLAR